MASKKKKEAKKKQASKPKQAKASAAPAKKGLIDRLQQYWSQKSPVLKFLVGFAACMIVFYIIYLSPFFVEYIGIPLLHVQAKIGSLILNLFGQGTQAVNDVITGEGFSVSIKNGVRIGTPG